MYQIFIVDDESWILERLVTAIDWKSIGAKVVGKAMNGKEALQKIQKQRIDVLITDIRMPEIDGLELIEQVKKEQKLVKSIIISGYSDFEYARKAISEGVSDYITKPVEDEELLSKVKKCCHELEKERWYITNAEEKYRINKFNMEMLQQQYLERLISGTQIDEITLEELGSVGISTSFPYYVCMEIAFDDKNEKRNISLSLFVLENILADLSAEYGTCYCLQKDLDTLICILGILKNNDTENCTIDIADKLCEIMNGFFGLSISIGIGDYSNSLYSISCSVKKASEALQNRYFFGGNTVYNWGDKIILQSVEKPAYGDIMRIANYIKVGLKEKAVEECKFFIQQLKFSNSNIRPIYFKIIFQTFIAEISDCCFHSERIKQTIYNSDYFRMLNTIHNIEKLEDAMVYNISLFCDLMLMAGQGSRKQTIETIIYYIEQHYGERITLEDVAGMVYLNTSYFCKIFKEEMGESFVNYLIRYRMKKASEFLEDFSLKIYEIAELVGYNDLQYFTKLYKKIHGISPKKYRMNLISRKV